MNRFLAKLPAVLSAVAVFFVTACGPDQDAGSQSGYLVTFAEKDAVTDFTPTRMIVTPRYLRIDEGVDGNDFVLFDRKDRLIYSVTAEDRTILVVQPREITLAMPTKFEHREDRHELADSPMIEGKAVTRYEMFTNDKKCYEIFAVPDLMEDLRQALMEYQTVLAGEHAAMAVLMPADMQSDCDLANNVFIPSRHLEHGFPIRLLDMTGRERNLDDFQADYQPNPDLFKLPAGYKRFSAEEMRAGGGQ